MNVILPFHTRDMENPAIHHPHLIPAIRLRTTHSSLDSRQLVLLPTPGCLTQLMEVALLSNGHKHIPRNEICLTEMVEFL